LPVFGTTFLVRANFDGLVCLCSTISYILFLPNVRFLLETTPVGL